MSGKNGFHLVQHSVVSGWDGCSAGGEADAKALVSLLSPTGILFQVQPATLVPFYEIGNRI